MLLAIAALFICLLGVSAVAVEAKQPISHEVLWLLKQVGAPAASPDGRWAVIPVTEPAYDEKEELADLWIVRTDGTAVPRRLTTAKSKESAPSWSPDSRQMAFSTKREAMR